MLCVTLYLIAVFALMKSLSVVTCWLPRWESRKVDRVMHDWNQLLFISLNVNVPKLSTNVCTFFYNAEHCAMPFRMGIRCRSLTSPLQRWKEVFCVDIHPCIGHCCCNYVAVPRSNIEITSAFVLYEFHVWYSTAASRVPFMLMSIFSVHLCSVLLSENVKWFVCRYCSMWYYTSCSRYVTMTSRSHNLIRCIEYPIHEMIWKKTAYSLSNVV